MTSTIETNARCEEAARVLEIIRETRDTTALPFASFDELCTATVFYLKGGHNAEQTAKLVIEEIW